MQVDLHLEIFVFHRYRTYFSLDPIIMLLVPALPFNFFQLLARSLLPMQLKFLIRLRASEMLNCCCCSGINHIDRYCIFLSVAKFDGQSFGNLPCFVPTVSFSLFRIHILIFSHNSCNLPIVFCDSFGKHLLWCSYATGMILNSFWGHWFEFKNVSCVCFVRFLHVSSISCPNYFVQFR